jgi:acyl-coenzyme A synthetase/AMP-(fatty) acid ligase
MPGDRHAITTYAQLELMIRNVARRAPSLGLKRGDTVLIVVEHHAVHTALILGLTHAGIVTISGRDGTFPKGLKIDAVVADGPSSAPKNIRVIGVDFSWTFGAGTPADELPPDRVGDAPCRIIFTSGTTGEAKAAAFTHRMTDDRILRFNHILGSQFPTYSRIYLDFGFATSLGFLFLIHTLTRGGLVIFIGDSYRNTANALDLYDAQCWLGSPAGLAKFAEYYQDSQTPGCRLQMIFSGGSLLAKSLAERVRKSMCAYLIAGYGSTEANMTAAAPVQLIEQVEGAVGFLLPGVTVETVDESNKPLPRSSTGVIRIRSPYTVTEYVGDPAESAKVFCDGWFYPGDIGRITPDNMLVISGRLKSVINVGGDKISPEVIENSLTAIDGVDEAAVVSVNNRFGIAEIWAVIAAEPSVTEAQVFDHCRNRLSLPFVLSGFIRADSLPKNQMGKIDRARILDLIDRRRHSSRTGIPKSSV